MDECATSTSSVNNLAQTIADDPESWNDVVNASALRQSKYAYACEFVFRMADVESHKLSSATVARVNEAFSTVEFAVYPWQYSWNGALISALIDAGVPSQGRGV